MEIWSQSKPTTSFGSVWAGELTGADLHRAMLERCSRLMEKPSLTQDEGAELTALAAACEAYEEVVWPIPETA